MQRAKIEEAPTPKYFQKPTEFFSSGSTLLDLVLGNGWALRRVFNIVGDKSTGKTLVGIEAFANFERKYPNCLMRYAEAEAAFDNVYAKDLGFPDKVTRPEKLIRTVEEFRDDVKSFITDSKKVDAGLYILDSLDSLSDKDELERFQKGEIDKGSYGMGKAKGMSEFFRLLVQDIADSNCSLGIISQIRDNIGVTFGNHYTRSGGHGLDFYATHVIWLHHMGMLERTVMGDDRAYGIEILAKCKKNKVCNPFREAEQQILFGYGIDDEISNLNWLKKIKSIPKETFADLVDKVKTAREKQDLTFLREISAQLKQDVRNIWSTIEAEIKPKVRKYEVNV